MSGRVTYIDRVCNLVAQETGLKSKMLINYYALLVLVKGENVTLSDIHDGWAMNMNFKDTTPYCYGHDHYSIVPFDQLSEACQNKDIPYMEALHRVARKLKVTTNK